MFTKAFLKKELSFQIVKTYFFKVILSIFILLFSIGLFAQGTNLVYEKLKVGEAQNLFSGIALSPDKKTAAISSTQSFPLNLYDLESKSVTQRFDVGNWYAGSRIEYSANGRYLILNQLFYMDWAPNKDREVNFEIVDANTGESIKIFNNYNDVKLTPDEKYAVSLFSGDISFWNLETGEKEKSFHVDQATNSIAISPDGKKIAVSHHPHDDYLKNNPMWLNNKKNRTNLEKYKQNITVFDINSFKPLYTIDEFYDIIYRMTYSEDGNYLFIYSIPNSKLQTTTDRKSYVSTANGVSGEPLSIAFPSLAVYEPDFKLSHSGKYFCISSMNGRYPEVHLYDFESGQMVSRFEEGRRLFEKSSEFESPGDGRISFIFMPDDSAILMTFGNRLINWTINP